MKVSTLAVGTLISLMASRGLAQTMHVISNFSLGYSGEEIFGFSLNDFVDVEGGGSWAYWAYPLDLCVATGIFGTSASDAIFSCVDSTNIMVTYFNGGKYCAASESTSNMTWSIGNLMPGDLGYFMCMGDNSYVKINYAVGLECSEPIYDYTTTAATNVCTRTLLTEQYTMTTCNDENATIAQFNGSRSSYTEDCSLLTKQLEGGTAHVNCTFFDNLEFQPEEAPVEVTVTSPVFARVQECVIDDTIQYSTMVPESDGNYEQLINSIDYEPGEGSGTTESVSRHFVGEFKIVNGVNKILWAYPLKRCVPQGSPSPLTSKKDVWYECDGVNMVKKQYKQGKDCAEDKLEKTETIEPDSDLMPGQLGYFKCDGEENLVIYKFAFNEEACMDDEMSDETWTQMAATNVCMQPDGTSESYTWTNCSSETLDVTYTVFTDNECTTSTQEPTKLDSETCENVGNSFEEFEDFDDVSVAGETYELVATVTGCVEDGDGDGGDSGGVERATGFGALLVVMVLHVLV